MIEGIETMLKKAVVVKVEELQVDVRVRIELSDLCSVQQDKWKVYETVSHEIRLPINESYYSFIWGFLFLDHDIALSEVRVTDDLQAIFYFSHFLKVFATMPTEPFSHSHIFFILWTHILDVLLELFSASFHHSGHKAGRGGAHVLYPVIFLRWWFKLVYVKGCEAVGHRQQFGKC